jgi:hypothetical protein
MVREVVARPSCETTFEKTLLLQSWTQNGSCYWIVTVSKEDKLGALFDFVVASP